jgi:hypothetical protein
MTGGCIICDSSTSQKIANLQKLEISLCINPSCVEKFLKLRKGELPICLYCEYFVKKKQLCPIVEDDNTFLMKTCGGIDLKEPRFGLFCQDFIPKDSGQGRLIMRG